MLIKHAHFHNDDLYRVLKYMTVNEALIYTGSGLGFIMKPLHIMQWKLHSNLQLHSISIYHHFINS